MPSRSPVLTVAWLCPGQWSVSWGRGLEGQRAGEGHSAGIQVCPLSPTVLPVSGYQEPSYGQAFASLSPDVVSFPYLTPRLLTIQEQTPVPRFIAPSEPDRQPGGS